MKAKLDKDNEERKIAGQFDSIGKHLIDKQIALHTARAPGSFASVMVGENHPGSTTTALTN